VYKKFRVYIAKYKIFTNNKHYFNGTPVIPDIHSVIQYGSNAKVQKSSVEEMYRPDFYLLIV